MVENQKIPVTTLIYRLPKPEQRIFAAECADFALPTYLSLFPQHEGELQSYISVARQYAQEGETRSSELELARKAATSLKDKLQKETAQISHDVWQKWFKDPRQRKGPMPTRDESEDIPRSIAWLDSHMETMKSVGQVAAWWHSPPAQRMEYAKLANALSVIDAIRWLTMSEDFTVVHTPSNPRAKASILSHTQKMGNVISQTASHKAETAAMKVLPPPPAHLIHYYGVGRGHGLGVPDPAATGMRNKMQAARREAVEIEVEWQRKKIETALKS